jgi:hypothetical protein
MSAVVADRCTLISQGDVHRYWFGSLRVDSALSFDSFEQRVHGTGAADHLDTVDVTIGLGQGAAPDVSPRRTAAGEVEADHVFAVPLFGTCRLRGSTIEMWLADTCTTELAEHVVVDHALPRWLGRRGDLAFHGAGIALDGVAIGIVAQSGTGKSTLANALIANGGRWVADDCLWLSLHDGYATAQRTFVGSRLLLDSRTALGAQGHEMHPKISKHVVTGPIADGATPLAALIHLVRCDLTTAPQWRGVTGAEAVKTLVPHWYGAPACERIAIVQKLAAVLRTVTLWELTIPSSFDALGAVCGAVHTQISSLALINAGR